MNNFQCLGKTGKGERCKNTFVTSKWSNTLVCHYHKNQKVDFTYSSLKTFCKMKDVAYLIAKEIHDPQTFGIFAKLCKSTAKACHLLQEEKKDEFKCFEYFWFNHGNYILPNGTKFNNTIYTKDKITGEVKVYPHHKIE